MTFSQLSNAESVFLLSLNPTPIADTLWSPPSARLPRSEPLTHVILLVANWIHLGSYSLLWQVAEACWELVVSSLLWLMGLQEVALAIQPHEGGACGQGVPPPGSSQYSSTCLSLRLGLRRRRGLEDPYSTKVVVAAKVGAAASAGDFGCQRSVGYWYFKIK